MSVETPINRIYCSKFGTTVPSELISILLKTSEVSLAHVITHVGQSLGH